MVDKDLQSLIGLALFFFAGLAIIADALRRYLLVQRISNTATSKAGSAAVGLVELYGKAAPADDKKCLTSPISKTRCVYWAVEAEYFEPGMKGGWKVFYADSSPPMPFYLEDRSGRIMVDPEGADMVIPVDEEHQGHLSGKGLFGFKHRQMPEKVLDFVECLDETGRKDFRNLDKFDMIVYERYLAKGDQVYVLGTAAQRPGTPSHIASENLVVKKGMLDRILVIRDTPEESVIDDLLEPLPGDIFWGMLLSGLSLIFFLSKSGAF